MYAKSLLTVCFLITVFVIAMVWGMVDLKAQNMSLAHTNTQKANHLADSFSPYLRQHMYNPVDWYEWGDEALERARRENKPILVSIGYSTCYWCHVLEREVFMHEDAAAIMNEHFINIKVDREVRPDIDKIYMIATQSVTGSGGWPNNVFLTPDLKPFHGVTYLPKDRWIELSQKVALKWADDRQNLENQGQQLSEEIKESLSLMPPLQASLPVYDLAKRSYMQKAAAYDSRYGGFGAGIKFPEESDLLFLIDFAKMKGDRKATDMVKNTVDHMLAGGIHDQVGGGFHRYSTDAQWHIPHFEKMLYNQALMGAVLANLYKKTGEPHYERGLRRLLDYVVRDMTDTENGAFYSAQDAETDAVEGVYYVWGYKDLNNVLGPEDFDVLMSVYATTYVPHYPGHQSPKGAVLYRSKEVKDIESQDRLDEILAKLLPRRQKRKAPLRDEKILTAWNGMMIYSFAEAVRILKDESYMQYGEKAAQFILSNMRQKDGRLYRISMDGQPHQNAFFEDYAWLARGLMALYRVTGDNTYRDEAINIISVADRYFLDEKSGGYFMSDGSDGMFVRVKAGDSSGALPSGNAVIAHVFSDLYNATGDQVWKDRMDELISAFGQEISGKPYLYSHMIHAMMKMDTQVEQWLEPVKEGTGTQQAESDLGNLESKDKVNVKAYTLKNDSSTKREVVKVVLGIEDGWHINANPASMDFLIPTVVNIQTEQDSTLKVSYPSGEKIQTPLGALSVYSGTIEIISVVKSDKPIDKDKMRALIQVQACKDATCYPPSQIVVPLGK